MYNFFSAAPNPSDHTLETVATVTIPAAGGSSSFFDLDPPVLVKEGTMLGFKNMAGAEVILHHFICVLSWG